MTATFTNKAKNTPSFTSKIKGYAQQAIYGVGVYGIAIYGVGVANFGVIANQNKSGGFTSFLVTDEGDYLVTDSGDFLCGVIAGAVSNQSKS